jgi:hypothetical protein
VSSSTPPPSITWDELLDRAQRTLDHRSTSFVADAQDFARWILSQGTRALVDENLKLRAELEEWKARYEKVVNKPVGHTCPGAGCSVCDARPG